MDINQILCGDAKEVLATIPENFVDLVITSPPYAGDVRKSYSSVAADKYVEWFLPIAEQIKRVLKPNGSFILNINDTCVDGERSIYVYELVVAMKKQLGFNFIDRLPWVKGNGSAHGRTRRIDRFEYIFQFCKGTKAIFNVDAIRTPYSKASIARAKTPIKLNTSNRELRQLTGEVKYKNWVLNPLGSFPSGVMTFPRDSGKGEYSIHTAPFHISLPEHFIKAHSNPGDLILDPFCGRGTSLKAAKNLNRNYLGIDKKLEYIELAKKYVNS